MAIFNLMEDAATAEISRAQLWQWLNHGAKLGGDTFSSELYRTLRDEELEKLDGSARLDAAAALLDTLVLGDTFLPFLTLEAYPQLS